MKNTCCHTAAVLMATTLAVSAYAQTPPAVGTTARPATHPTPVLRPCSSVVVDPPTVLTLGKSRVVRLDFPVARVIVGGEGMSRAGRPATPAPGTPPGAPPRVSAAAASDGVADTEVTLLSPTELFF